MERRWDRAVDMGMVALEVGGMAIGLLLVLELVVVSAADDAAAGAAAAAEEDDEEPAIMVSAFFKRARERSRVYTYRSAGLLHRLTT